MSAVRPRGLRCPRFLLVFLFLPNPPHAHPQMHMWAADRDLPHSFDDPKLLSSWSQKKGYRYADKLEPTQRDFPEARARLGAQ